MAVPGTTSEMLYLPREPGHQGCVSYRPARVPLAVGLVALPGEARSAAVPWASGLADLGTEVGLPRAPGPLDLAGRNAIPQALKYFPRQIKPSDSFHVPHRLHSVGKHAF